MKTLLYFVAEDWYFCSHRLETAKAVLAEGYRVIVVCNVDKHREVIEKAGIEVLSVSIERSSLGLLSNIKLLQLLIKLFKNIRPDIVHNVAQKPVLIGSVAAKLAGIPLVVNALGGMGYIFISSEPKARILKALITFIYRRLFNLKGMRLILQNRDDFAFFREQIKVQPERLHLVRGAGVNTDDFTQLPFPDFQKVRVTLVARMLKDKGIREFIEAAKLLIPSYPHAEFCLVGSVDLKNPNSFSTAELHQLCQQSGVVWNGERSDILNVWRDSHISVLPSYREGLPKSLLESAAVGRPIVTTDVPGCREVVEESKNGYLVPLYDTKILTERISSLLDSPELCMKMGQRSREMAENAFSSYKVNEQILALYKFAE